MIGDQIGSYRITGIIGEGGMGVVYLAEHPVIGQKVAIKVLRPRYSGDREAVARLFNEARAAALAKHPGIVNVYDAGHHEASGAAYLVMEYLTGEPLARRLDRVRRLPDVHILRFGRQLASALDAAHRNGIIHRDLTPDNIFLVADPAASGGERVKILDFGVAKLAGHHRSDVRTKTGQFVGNPGYMAPEQFRAGTVIDGRVDIYALGCVLLEMAAGVAPYSSAGLGEVVAQKLYEPSPSAEKLAPHASADLRAIIDKALAKEPQDRFASMAEMLAAIENAAARAGLEVASAQMDLARPPAAPPPPSAPAPAVAPRAGRTAPWIGGGIALFGGAIALAIALSGSGSATVTLRVNSVPEGATVYRTLDGVRVGVTPLTGAYTRGIGELELVVKLAGYEDERVTLSTAQDGAATVTLRSSPRTGP